MAPPALTGARTTATLYTRMDAIAAASGGICTVAQDSGFTSQGRGQRLRYLRIASTKSGTRQAVLITGGLHAREWAPPDALLQLAEYLIDAYRAGAPIDLPVIRGSEFTVTSTTTDTVDLPAHRISRNEVERVLDKLEIFIAPIVNPDGRDYTMVAVSGGPTGPNLPQLWRKNDPPPDGTDPNPTPVRGVNLNGNFPVPSHSATLGSLWKDLQRYYGPGAFANLNASDDPAHWDLYVGPTEASANETKFVKWLVETKHVRFFMDVHSSAHLVSYPWAMEKNGSDASKTFMRADWDSTPGPPHTAPAAHPSGRDGTTGDAYSELMPDTSPHQLLRRHRTVARSMRDSIFAAAGSHPNAAARSRYNDEQGNRDGSIAELLYAAPASGMDWVFSRQFTTPAPAPIFGFAFEVGDSEEGAFWPNYSTQFRKIEREVVIGTMEFLKFAAAWRPPSSSRCYVMSAAFGSSFHPEVEYVVQLREGLLRKTRIGRRFLSSAEKLYDRFGPHVGRAIDRHPRLRGVVRRAFVEPLVRVIRRSAEMTRALEPREHRAAVFLALLASWFLAWTLGLAIFVGVVFYWVFHA